MEGAAADVEDRSGETSIDESTEQEGARSVGMQLVSEPGTREVEEVSVEAHAEFATVTVEAAGKLDLAVELAANPGLFD